MDFENIKKWIPIIGIIIAIYIIYQLFSFIFSKLFLAIVIGIAVWYWYYNYYQVKTI